VAFRPAQGIFLGRVFVRVGSGQQVFEFTATPTPRPIARFCSFHSISAEAGEFRREKFRQPVCPDFALLN